MTKPLLLVEFNELAPALMDRFIAAGELPNFARFRSESETFVTDAEATGETLNPWVQWVTVHTGLAASDHGVRKLGEAGLFTGTTIADAVLAHGHDVWVCGSMNVRPSPGTRGSFLPDPWSVDARPRPAELEPFFRFVAANVQEHTNERSSLSRRDVANFGRFLVGHGLSIATMRAVVTQLARERTGAAGRWARAELLDLFQWDVFRYYHHRTRPLFSTFFSNSTAHFQHLFWRDMEPELFEGASPGGPERGAVLHGYRAMDALLGRIMAWAGRDVLLVFCTALSQRANADPGAVRGGFYRPHDLDQLASALGIVGVNRTTPAMAEQFHLLFADEASAADGATVLESARVSDDPVFDVRRTSRDVFAGCRIFEPITAEHPVEVRVGRRSIDFARLFYWADAPRSGTHHPDGMLWIRTGPRSTPSNRRAPLTAVAPTLLDLLEVPAPPSMAVPPLLDGLRRHGDSDPQRLDQNESEDAGAP